MQSPVCGERPHFMKMNDSQKQLSIFSESNKESRKRKKSVPTLESKIDVFKSMHPNLNDLINSGRSVLAIVENDIACVAKLK